MPTCASCSGEMRSDAVVCPHCGATGDLSTAPTRARAPEVVVARRTPGDAPSPHPSDPGHGSRFPPGTLIGGRYRIVGPLGKGGMGEVYRADDLKLGQTVALKFLPESVKVDPGRLARFLNEVRVAREVTHANVCRVHDIGEADGLPFISMEYVDGEDLSSLLRRIGRLPKDKGIEIARQLCAGLAAAHDRGVLHRDLKPANVMIDGRGRVRITDFGLAGLAEGIARDDMSSGTPAYMAPEQFAGREVSLLSDVYSLGLVLYELFTGRRPFEGRTLAELARGHQSTPPPSPSGLATEIDPVLERAILRCLEKDPRARPASAVAVAAALPGGDAIAAAIKPKWWLVGLLSVMVLIVGFFGYRSFTAAEQIESIAVLPFVNASGNADVEYLSDGMTETLISSLSQLPKLIVKARSSVFRYKGKEFDLPKIARELKVRTILTGRVMQHGDQLTLSLELADAQTENAIWSEQYERKQADLLTLQSEIARDVSRKLKTKLSGAEEQKVAKSYTADPAAYQLYLKGRFYWNKRTGDGLTQAVGFYKQAIERDPNYALAYSGLAESYVLFPDYSVALPQDSMPKARAAAIRALEMDDSLTEAHAALGLYLSSFSWNQPAAERELRRAIELKPNYPTAHHWLGNGPLSAMGRFDESIAEGRRAEELDPLSPIISADTGANLFRARRFDEALAQFNRTLGLDPNFYFARYFLATIHHAKGEYREAVGEYRKALALNDDPFVRSLLACSLAKSGQGGEAIKMLEALKAESAHRYVPSAGVALAYAALGDKDQASVWLEKEFAERTSRPAQFSVSPLYDDVRDDPRFVDLVRRVALAKTD